VVKLAYTPDLGSGAFGRAGSSPAFRTHNVSATPRVTKTLNFDDFTALRAAETQGLVEGVEQFREFDGREANSPVTHTVGNHQPISMNQAAT